MATRSRFSTSTVVESAHLVPWLSAEGPLAYSPIHPPESDYFFQYTWILPGIFNPEINLREHRYFGSPLKESARFLFEFWANASRGLSPSFQQYCELGLISDYEVRTPMAAYHHGFCGRPLARRPAVLLAQPDNGDPKVRSSPCRTENPSEQHPDHDVLRG